jgi:hypothetical protein
VFALLLLFRLLLFALAAVFTAAVACVVICASAWGATRLRNCISLAEQNRLLCARLLDKRFEIRYYTLMDPSHSAPLLTRSARRQQSAAPSSMVFFSHF